MIHHPLSRLSIALLLGLGLGTVSGAGYDYAEVLQKGLYFFECQEAGELSPGNRVVWRGPSTLADGAEVGLDLSGGWYDAGDHWKANSTMAKGGSFLAWSVITYPDVYLETGQLPHALNSLRHIVDYFRRCIVDPQPGSPADFTGYTVYVDVGGRTTPTAPDPGVHGVWCAPEVIDGYTVREPLRIDASVPNGNICGAMAGCLASAAQVFHLYGTAADRSLAAELLPIAAKLTDFGRTNPDSDKRAIRPNGSVVSNGYLGDYPWDALVWARVWLHRASQAMAVSGYSNAHLADARAILDEQEAAGQLSSFTAWWRERGYNHASMLAWLQTDHSEADRQRLQPPLQQLFTLWYEADPDAQPATSQFYHSPYGLKTRKVYGSAFSAHRVFRNVALAAMYADWTADATERSTFGGYVQDQIDYFLGDNKQGQSFVIGVGEAGRPDPLHHRGAHGSWASHANRIASDPLYLPRTRHILYGAVIGGPDGEDAFTDGTFEHTTTEPTITSAGTLQVIAAYLVAQDPTAYQVDPDFPPPPVRDLSLDPEWTDREIYVAGRRSAAGSDFISIDATLYNRSSWPARVLSDASFRYYFTADQAAAAASDFSLTIDGGQGAQAGAVVDLGDGTFYAEVRFPAERLLPDSRLGVKRWRRDVQFTLRCLSGDVDPADDWSAATLDATRRVQVQMPVYQGEDLVGGLAPDATDNNDPVIASVAADPAPVTADRTTLSVVADDADGDDLQVAWSLASAPEGASPTLGSGVAPLVIFDRAGSYGFAVTVSDGKGGSATSELTVVVEQTANGVDLQP